MLVESRRRKKEGTDKKSIQKLPPKKSANIPSYPVDVTARIFESETPTQTRQNDKLIHLLVPTPQLSLHGERATYDDGIQGCHGHKGAAGR